ncbi:unnamed protein product [marine sediment metagenome]|uniref:Uncharacterized protein n=1 Tax=marine sediment metagenome TaxID=412755 RepID=X0U7J2_9ZZZZ
MPETKPGNYRAIVQAVWSDASVSHCVVTEVNDQVRSLGDMPANTADKWLVKYRLFYPDDTDLLARAIQEATALTAAASGSDSEHERNDQAV